MIKARSQAGARPRRGAPCPKCGHSELHHHEDRLKRSMWVGPCRSCGPFQKGRCEGAQFKVEEIAKSQPTDKPVPGKVYSLTGPRSIASGDTWQGSEVWCNGTRSDHSAYGCRAKADHEHVGPDHIRHMRGAAKLNGCTPERCGLAARKSWSQVGGNEHRHDQNEGSHRHMGGATPHEHAVGACGSKSCQMPDAPHSDKPNWRRAGPQVYVDGWRGGTHRVLRHDGNCVGCGRRTYSFDDGENDPRGVLGDHASSSESAEDYGYPKGLKDVPACFNCMNDEPQYRKVQKIAHARWGREVGSGKSVPDKLPKDITDMGKAAAFNPFRARVRKINVGEPAIGGKVRPVRTQGVKWDDMRDRGKTKDTGDFSYEPKVTGKRTWQKSEPVAPRPVGQTPWAHERTQHTIVGVAKDKAQMEGALAAIRRARAGGMKVRFNISAPDPAEVTNPAAVKQIKEARANGMGAINKAKPDADPYDVALLQQRNFRIKQEQDYNDRINAQNEKYRAHRAANHPDEFSCVDCKWPSRAYLEKARKPDQYPPDYPDGFVTEVHRDTRICKGCGMPSGEHLVGCRGGGTEKVSDQVVKKAGVVFGTRPFARRALPKGQLTRERAGAPRYRKALSCVCGDELGSHIGEGGCAACARCTAFVKAQPVFVLRMRKSADDPNDLKGGMTREEAKEAYKAGRKRVQFEGLGGKHKIEPHPTNKGKFVLRYTPRIKKSESVEVPSIPKCDFHPDAPAYADARLPSVGSWANVCKDCFHAHGASLGEGRGQVYVAEGRSKPQKSKAPACPRCAAGDFTRAKREDGLRHTATMKAPSIDTVMKWDFNSNHKATDGCKVEGDGLCRHGHQSWIRRMGIM